MADVIIIKIDADDREGGSRGPQRGIGADEVRRRGHLYFSLTVDAEERRIMQEIQQKEWHTQQMEENALKRRMAEASDKYVRGHVDATRSRAELSRR